MSVLIKGISMPEFIEDFGDDTTITISLTSQKKNGHYLKSTKTIVANPVDVLDEVEE